MKTMIDWLKLTVFIRLIILSYFSVSNAQFNNFLISEKANKNISNADFTKLESYASIYKNSWPTLENIINELSSTDTLSANLTTDCLKDIQLMTSEARLVYEGNRTEFTTTFLKMIDSSGKPGVGIMLGNIKWYGLFKECQAIKYDLDDRTFAGKYNQITFLLTNETTCNLLNTFGIDLCLPKNCETTDIREIVTGVLQDRKICEISSLPHEAHASVGTWVTLSIITMVVFLGLTASIFDYFVLPHHKNKPYVNSILMQSWRSFSFYTNVVEIFNTKGANKPGNIGPIHCMRFFSMCWVIMGHTLGICSVLSIDPLKFADFQTYRIFGIINNSYFSVDTFFWQSGLLLTFIWLKKYNQNHKQVMSLQAWILFYVHRIIRISPAYYLLIAFYTWIFKPFGTNNIALDAHLDSNECETNWWVNFLYLTNVINYRKRCYDVSWYLSTDMQLFAFTPIILIPLSIKKTYGVITALIILAMSTGIHVFQMYYYYFPPTLNQFIGGVDERMTVDNQIYMVMMYNAPWIRCQVYIVGMLTGVFLHSFKKLKISPAIQFLGWVMTIAIACGCLFTMKSFFIGNVVPLGWRTLFSATSKPLWGVGLSWIVIVCYYGYGSFINSFMSWAIWVPVGRLSYSTYLVHILVVYYLVSQNQQPFVISNFFQMFTMFVIPMIVWSMLFAVFWSSAFEFGFGKLETILINAIIKTDSNSKPQQPRASTFDIPTSKISLKKHVLHIHDSEKSFPEEVTLKSEALEHQRQHSVPTLEIPPLQINGQLKNINIIKNSDDDKWS